MNVKVRAESNFVMRRFLWNTDDGNPTKTLIKLDTGMTKLETYNDARVCVFSLKQQLVTTS